jgi:LacI family transcriptional regulator
MKTVLVLLTSTDIVRTKVLSGVREFAQGTDWEINHVDFDGSPLPIKDLIRFWSPIGCIVEATGDGASEKTIPKNAFGNVPVVYIGGDSHITPQNATCVVHDAVAAGEAAGRELMALGLENFAFVGMSGRIWSRRRADAFASVLRMNGKPLSAMDVNPGGKDNERLQAWLGNLPKPCGLFAASDSLAATVLSVCRRNGITVPNDVAVIGVDDNTELCESTSPTLSSIRPDFRQGGRLAARLLARKLSGRGNVPQTTVFAISGIVRRGSTRRFMRKDAWVASALERIWKPDGVRLSPKDVVADFPCSRRNAEIRFRRATGHSILEELTNARVDVAKRLLSETSLPISSIAEQCGYISIAHFRDAFRNSTGANPLAWRKTKSG